MPDRPRPSAYTIRVDDGYIAAREERSTDPRYYHWVHMYPPNGPLSTRAEVVTWLQSIGYRVVNIDRTDDEKGSPPLTP